MTDFLDGLSVELTCPGCGEKVSEAVGPLKRDEKITMKKEPRFCTRCKSQVVHPIENEVTGGQWAILVALILCFVLPGVLYAVYLACGNGARRLYVCPKCGARRMSVPLDSPAARAEIK
jgi:DNA-directed RNA polymerase subunit RPC12/RpoP